MNTREQQKKFIAGISIRSVAKIMDLPYALVLESTNAGCETFQEIRTYVERRMKQIDELDKLKRRKQ